MLSPTFFFAYRGLIRGLIPTIPAESGLDLALLVVVDFP